jgi:mRNA interferase YafQ
MERRGKNMDELWAVVGMLLTQKNLSEKYRDHPLSGSHAGSRDCHIQPDWILIYTIEGKNLILERTGTHSDLFR